MNSYFGLGKLKPILVVIDSKNNVNKVKLSGGSKMISIGRGQVNDIVLSENFVSSQHGCIFIENDKIFYVDANSNNGTTIIYPNKRLLMKNTTRRLELKDGVKLRIGEKNNPEKNVFMYVMNMGEEDLSVWNMSKAQTSIGRDSSNDIVLKSTSVSRCHAIIEKQGGQFVLKDSRSRNGVTVNGKAVNGEVVLKDKDFINILGYQLIFADGKILYKKKTSGISILADGINKYVGSKSGKKRILSDATVEIKGNEFVAIIGGSGAGKTTIMNVLNGFDMSYEGRVYYNGISVRENFKQLKSLVGYVPQEDIVYENLTLRKMLQYSAELRMPKDVSKQEINEKINEALDTLGLRQHQDTYIRKLSGGQKKRASIAVELLADPKLFFLDEPTSGLDPYTEKNLMQSLQNLSKSQERTIVMVTHTVQNLNLCDKVIFMGKNGRVCFAGSIDEAMKFFDAKDLTDIYYYIDHEPEIWQQKYMRMLEIEDAESNTNVEMPKTNKVKVSAAHQYNVVIRRYVELMKNDVKRLAMLIGEPMLIGLLLVIVVDEKLLDAFSATQSIMFAMSSAAIWVGIFNSIVEVCKERSILKREYMANLKLDVYLLSKVAVQMILGLIQVLLMTLEFFALTVVFKDTAFEFADLFDEDQLFFGIVLTLWLTVIAAEALGFIISSVVKSGDKAMAVAPIVLIIQLLCSGILFEFKGASETISYFAMSRWSMEALGRYLKFNQLSPLTNMDPTASHSSHYKDMYVHDSSLIIHDWGVLAAMAVISIVISIILLRNVAKDSR